MMKRALRALTIQQTNLIWQNVDPTLAKKVFHWADFCPEIDKMNCHQSSPG